MRRWLAGAGVLAGAAGVAAWAATHPRAQLFGPTLRHTGRPGTLALTFDDGPNPACTPRLLDLLHRHSARATFFMIGERVRRDPGLAREVAARGHAVGNHTATHRSLVWMTPGETERELAGCEEMLDQVLGGGRGPASRRWMRPPYGWRGPQLDAVVRGMGLAGVAMWGLLGFDWNPQPAVGLIGRLARARRSRPGGRGGDVIALHDGDSRRWGADRAWLLAALEHWLPRWRDEGVEFLTVDAIAS